MIREHTRTRVDGEPPLASHNHRPCGGGTETGRRRKSLPGRRIDAVVGRSAPASSRVSRPVAPAGPCCRSSRSPDRFNRVERAARSSSGFDRPFKLYYRYHSYTPKLIRGVNDGGRSRARLESRLRRESLSRAPIERSEAASATTASHELTNQSVNSLAADGVRDVVGALYRRRDCRDRCRGACPGETGVARHRLPVASVVYRTGESCRVRASVVLTCPDPGSLPVSRHLLTTG